MRTPSVATAPDAPFLGILSLAAGVIVFVAQDVIIKLLSGAYPLHEMLFIRCIAGVPFVLAIAIVQRNPAAFRLHRAGIARGSLHFVSFSCYYLALAVLPLAEVTTLYYANPLFITALSVPLLGDKVGWRRWAAVLVGFAGVVVVLQPDTGTIEPAMLVALGAAFTCALSMLVTRMGGGQVPATGFALHSIAILLVLSSLAGLAIGDGRFDPGDDVGLGYLLRAWSFPHGLDLFLLAATGRSRRRGSCCWPRPTASRRPAW
jgi:drug/metabolite transporter (DMT)-like permease